MAENSKTAAAPYEHVSYHEQDLGPVVQLGTHKTGHNDRGMVGLEGGDMFRHLRHDKHTTEDTDQGPEGNHKVSQGFRWYNLSVSEKAGDWPGQPTPRWRREIWVDMGIDVHM